MPLSRRSKLLIIAGVALAFGIADAALKGHHGGVRDALGNISATWLILPLLGGAFVSAGQPAVGALAGLAATLMALAGFYVIGWHVLGIGVSPYSHHQLTLTTALGNRWLEAGSVSGLAIGAAGGWLAARRSMTVVGAAVAALLILEPAARGLDMAGKGVSPGGFDSTTAVWIAEVLTGLALVAVLWLRRAQTRA